VAGIIDADVLNGANSISYGIQVARLRSDEALDRIDSYSKIDDNANVRLDYKKVPDSPPPLPEGSVRLHDDRIVCPAVHVEGLMKLVGPMLPEIVLEVQRQMQTPKRYMGIKVPPLPFSYAYGSDQRKR
jgi:hypothetical protein